MKTARTTERLVQSVSCDPASFRQAAARFPTGVTVITCIDESGMMHGMTANSFVSVSLSPPTVLISVKPGRMHAMIEADGRYAINILGATGENISRHFSGRPQPGVAPEFHIDCGMPVLSEAIAHFVCNVTDSVRVHDHTLFIGNVITCGHKADSPLVFFGSRYCTPQTRDWLAHADAHS
ncbi:styrene monooxygenase NADH-dependent flavin reductase subunit StyB [Paraburkholderia domus]|uniref:styrene monooxygenase NADH-dependent flavin reductase subunit StyB n=1 Tax=Paraburkholderia domus TaxID=2793075 RepID=UPI0019125516|nr:flavin reductase family protein [Paraburkholderia domus]MBK5052283.1 flavin reductase family protein [Burkholderia sp. R-70006]MBK5182118.1 flavin reductase family protein [Burkholderia sp. R-69749]MCI0150052.1 flavin reductase [Paraburkholderia sediminicola]CAE6806068.1 FMN reductase (NADH) RutF [Paraburkholderia domus]CAE6841156.1 FMN reductase (NADH) RutF [Paraburkholderia domus]